MLALIIGGFYFWTAVPQWDPGLIARNNSGYYNLLTRGFMKGHLYLDLPADPFLATLKDPSNPVQRAGHGVHDASYYHGRYYIYFGVTPVLLVYLPFRLLTGYFIDDALVVPLFACGGLVMSILLLQRVRARYFPAASLLAFAGGVVGLGLANLVPMLLRRTSVWEVPISCGYFCCMAALYALFRAWHSSRRAGWLGLASGAFGLAVGSRPTYLLGTTALLYTFWAFWREERGPPFSARIRTLGLAAFLPIATVGLGLALYNFLRFGSPLDFGFRHLMNGEQVSTERLFSWQFLWYNLRVYALAPAGWSPYFPYVALARLPAPPADYLVVEDPYGVLPNLPFVLLGLGVLGVTAANDPRSRLRPFCFAVVLAAAGTGLMTASFGGAINRYMVDFVPAWVVLGAIGLLALVTRPSFRGRLRVIGGIGIGALVAYSAAFDVLASIRHNELFRSEHRALYERVAHAGNYPSYAIDRLLGVRYGPLELKVIFPEQATGAIEPLVVTGRDFLADYLFVHYLGPGSVRFGLDHTSHGTIIGEPVTITPGAVQTLRIELGSLYPPPGDPYFDSVSAVEARLRQCTLRVTCNGQVALERRTDFYDASARLPSIGTSAGRPGFTRPFSGRIVSWTRLRPAMLATLPTSSSAKGSFLRLVLRLPPFPGAISEPLLSSGDTGRGDLISLHYVGVGRIAFGYDHWGYGGGVSAPLAVDARGLQTIDVDFGPLHPHGPPRAGDTSTAVATFRLVLNGRTVFDLPAPYYPCDPNTVAVGLNTIQATSAGESFSGSILKVESIGSTPSR